MTDRDTASAAQLIEDVLRDMTTPGRYRKALTAIADAARLEGMQEAVSQVGDISVASVRLRDVAEQARAQSDAAVVVLWEAATFALRVIGTAHPVANKRLRDALDATRPAYEEAKQKP